MPTLSIINFNIVCACLGGFITVFGLVSYLFKERLYLSEPLISLTAGIIFSPHATNLIRPLEYALGSQENLETITLYFTRLVLGVQLVLAGVQLPSRNDNHVATDKPDDMGTDPVLSNSIVKGKFADKNIPKPLQNIIIAESGANDGLGYPFLFLALYLIQYTQGGGSDSHGGAGKAIEQWVVETWVYTILLSVVYGAVVGWLAKELLHAAEERKFVDRESFLVFAVALALFITGTCGIIGSDDVLACFVAGNVFTWDDWFRLETEDDSLQPTIDMLLNISIFVWFGAVAPWHTFRGSNVIPIYRLIPLGILILLFRRVPMVMLFHKQIPHIQQFQQALYVGFFGPMGVSAIFYLYVSIEFLNQVLLDGKVRTDALQLQEVMRVVVWFIKVSLGLLELRLALRAMAENTASPPAEASRTSPLLVANNAAAGAKRKRAPEKKFYAVREGRTPGVYGTWTECLAQVRGHKGAFFKAFQSLHEANAFVDGTSLTSPSSNLPGEQKFYAVQNGKKPGVYLDWPSAMEQIRGVKGPRHRRFNTMAEAQAYVDAGKKNLSYELSRNLSPEEEIRQLIVRKSAPGLLPNGAFQPKDREGNPYPLGTGPLPPGAEDHFDPNLKLAADGTIQQKTGIGVYFGPQDPKYEPPPSHAVYTIDWVARGAPPLSKKQRKLTNWRYRNVSEALKGSKQTNQRAELTAIQRALDIAPRHRDVTIYTDSKYAIECSVNWYKNWVKNGWKNSQGKPVENKDVIMDIREQIEERDLLKRQTIFCWVKGHANDEGNIAADKLAQDGSRLGIGISDQDDDEEDAGMEADDVGRSSDDGDYPKQTNGDDLDVDEARQVQLSWQAMEQAMRDKGGKQVD
ncbi:hypothetical protein DV736_g1575, partial [Chaetothyriales sp. CBS 134916]